MILSFKTQIKGLPTQFLEKIRACYSLLYNFRPKKHTIRRGKRWKKGMKLHMAYGVRTKSFFQFAGFGTGNLEYCTDVQDIEIKNIFDDRNAVIIDGRALLEEEIKELALNDGFDCVDAFWDFFMYEDFEGQIIHWTDLKY